MIINVQGKSIDVERAKLYLWFKLEDIGSSLKGAVERGDTRAVSLTICSYLSAASDEGIELFQEAPWEEVATAFLEIRTLNSPRLQFPLFNMKDPGSFDTVSWEYEGRTWYFWVHLLAKAYGWTEEYISNLEIDSGLAFIQETLVEDQLKKEWQWSLTEFAYEYIKGSNISKFKPLPRPDWMRERRKEPKKVKMPTVLLPTGNIENISGMGLHGAAEDVVH